MKNLQDLFEHQLKDIYSAEKQLVDALPMVNKAASSAKLKKEIDSHIKQTEKHFSTIQKICDKLDINPTNTKCDAMAGLIKECKGMSKKKADANVKDAGLIASLQRIEHYEISAYGTARQYSEALGHKMITKSLKRILEQEQKADTKLNKLAINTINQKALQN